jgi:hypothetical protein
VTPDMIRSTDAAFVNTPIGRVRRQLALFDGPGTPYVYHVIATNWSPHEKSAQAVLDWYHQRGEVENFTKELKHGVGLERVPCGETWANAIWCRLGGIAYNLFIGFKRLACPTAWARHMVATLRWTLVQVAGRIVRHAGRFVLKLGIETDTLTLFRGMRQQCWALHGGV